MTDSSPRLGFIGLGLMGTPMCRQLLQAGYPVSVWNRTPAKAAPALNAGATWADSVSELVKQVDIVMLCVTDTQAVKSLVFSSGGIAESAQPGQLLVDFSSIAPEASREMAQRMKTESGMDWVDAPVSGGVAGAKAGTLAIMAGGDADVIDQIRPLLAPLSQRVTHMGPVGSGQATKVCNQMLVSCNLLVMAEVLALATKAGVDASMIPTALKGGFADSLPLQITGPRMAARDFDHPQWHVKTLLKDLNMAEDLAALLNARTPMAKLGTELMKKHTIKGYSDQDPATLIDQYSD